MRRVTSIFWRAALWNQDKLTALRDHMSTEDGGDGEQDIDANSCTPGLTGAGRIIGTTTIKPENKGFLAVA